MSALRDSNPVTGVLPHLDHFARWPIYPNADAQPTWESLVSMAEVNIFLWGFGSARMSMAEVNIFL
jgi:hypothetical protein